MTKPIFENIYQIGIIPVLVFDSPENAVPTAQSLTYGGIPVAEVTLRTEAAFSSISRIAHDCPDVLVGAGTVINLDQAVDAYNAGASFLVSPGLSPEIAIWAKERKIPILCGAVTPTEIMQGINLEMTIFKFFPSADMGGTKMMKALSGPFPKIRFVPTGGINQENLVEHLENDFIFAVGGSWIAKRSMINQKQYKAIENLASKASELVRDFRES